MRPLIRVLDEDLDLGRALNPVAHTTARDHALAVVHEIPRGTWDGKDVAGDEPGQLGLLVVAGFLIRDVPLAGGRCSELVGRGDVLRPWDDAAPYAPVRVESQWTVLQPARVAVLDRRFAAAIARWPELPAAIVSRLITRSLWLACLIGLGRVRRVDARLHALFWLLAYRWGHVESQGVVVSLSLTHELLGRLVGAERPTVTRSLKTLYAAESISRRRDGTWLLRGEAPDTLPHQPAAPLATTAPQHTI